MPGKQIEENGERLTYTCLNARFKTDISKGHPHGAHSDSRGSVFTEPLADHNGDSLWLEHVCDHKHNESDFYWLMWYDSQGRPNMTMSGILNKADLTRMQGLFAGFIPE